MSDTSPYIGVWTDYSKNDFERLTLTLPTSSAAYLTSALTVVVSLAGRSLWTIVSYLIHQYRVKDADSDLLDLQIRVLLRNDDSPLAVFRDAWSLKTAWSARKDVHAMKRLLPITAVAALTLAFSSVLAVFVSAIFRSSDPEPLVLQKSGDCGFLWLNETALPATYSDFISYTSRWTHFVDMDEATLTSRDYAKSFYPGSATMGLIESDNTSNKMSYFNFPVQSLPYTWKKAPCPFPGPDRCISSMNDSLNNALVLDTGFLDSNEHLGINAPASRRIQFRKYTACSVVNVSDLVAVEAASDGQFSVNLTGLLNDNGSAPVTFSSGRNALISYHGMFVLIFKSWLFPGDLFWRC